MQRWLVQSHFAKIRRSAVMHYPQRQPMHSIFGNLLYDQCYEEKDGYYKNLADACFSTTTFLSVLHTLDSQ